MKQERMPDVKNTIPLHQFTHDGDRVLMVKALAQNGSSHGGFQWPVEAGKTVEAPDWNEKPVCGGGLHAWAWGIGIGDGIEVSASMRWLVLSADPADVVLIETSRKVKARKVRIEYAGDMAGAMYRTSQGRIAWVVQDSRGSASASGYGGSASASGDGGSASASGVRGSASASGAMSAACATGEDSSLDISGTSAAAVVMTKFTWIARRGAVVLHRWKDARGRMHTKTLSATRAMDGKRYLVDGEKIKLMGTEARGHVN
ncbi:MAG: hypothetical protein LLG03_03935 [Planctomycetaceae bacterium]|nr:hypothetical protein [Planctomycetaceae bacterium]